MRGVRVAAWVGRVEAVNVGQEDQQVCPHHLGNAGGEAVIVAIADFFGGHRVVLVDHRQDAGFQQGFQRCSGVQPAAADLRVCRRQKRLAGRQAVRAESGSEGGHQARLADGGRSLLLVQPGCAGRADLRPAKRHRAGGDEDDLLPTRAAGSDVGGQLLQPGKPGVSVFGNQGRSGLYDNASGLGEDVSSHGAQRYMSVALPEGKSRALTRRAVAPQ
jgi:hypothetical protein